MTRKLILVDGNSIATAAFHGIKLTKKDGTHTGAVYGFIKKTFELMNDFPTHFAVTFDTDDGPKLRNTISADYKINRKPIDENLKRQLFQIRSFLEIMKIPFFTYAYLEADDILSWLAKRFHKEIPVYIATRDKDLFQVCKYPNVRVILISSKGTRICGPREIKEILGIGVEHLLLYKAFVGDRSNNVAGIKGIGPKTTIKLIQEYGGNMEEIIDNAKKGFITPTRLNALITDNIEALKTSFLLSKLIEKYPVEVSLTDLERAPANESNLERFYKDLELTKFFGA